MRAAKPSLLPFINEFGGGLQSPIQSKVLPRCKMSTKQTGGGAASENTLRAQSYKSEQCPNQETLLGVGWG